jgi:hypothetical protein
MPTIECVTDSSKIMDCGPGCCNPVSGPDIDKNHSEDEK